MIDPVLEEVPHYLKLIQELDLKLIFAVDTHLHADHITGLGSLKDQCDCTTVMGDSTKAECITRKVKEGEVLKVDGISLTAIFTPGHTDDSYSYQMKDRVLTGDTLLIRGTGRTDFQNGDPWAQYDSLFNKLLRLPEATFVYPAHDYKGWTVSTIGEERRCNPRLQVQSVEEYVSLMRQLKLPKPELMDVALPANLNGGRL